MTIIGVDPGSSRIGYCILKKGKKIEVVRYGLLEIKSRDPSVKITELAHLLSCLLKKYKPDCAAIEKLFFSKNKKTALEVAESIGVIKYILSINGIPYKLYTPQEVKLAVTGFGGADKRGVAKMVKMLLDIKEIKGPDDITDAIAVALTGIHSARTWAS